MKKSVRNLLTEERFWEIIENSQCGERLNAGLEKLTEDEILGFIYWWDYYVNETYRNELWAVAYAALRGCSDSGFDYFRYWLLTRGKAVVMAALADADSLCDEFDKLPKQILPQWEEVGYIAYDVFEGKSGKKVFVEMEKYDFDEGLERCEIEFTWDGDKPDTIKAICPRTFEKWWDSDKFELWDVCSLKSDSNYYIRKKPEAVLFGRERTEAHTWLKVFEAVLLWCNRDRHDALMNLRNKTSGKHRALLSDSPNGMINPVKIDEDLYAERSSDGAAALLSHLRERILDPVGLDYRDITVVLKRITHISMRNLEQHKDVRTASATPDPYERVYPLYIHPHVFVSTKPSAVLFGEERVEVKTWREVVGVILARCNEERRDALMNLRNKVLGKVRVIFSDSPSGMRHPLKIDDEMYVETHYGSETMMYILRNMILDYTGFDYSQIKITLKDGGRTQ
jgi:hypothetical protein